LQDSANKKYEAEWASGTEKDLAKLSTEDQERCINSFEEICDNPYSGDTKHLKGFPPDVRRLRVGDYRIVYIIKTEVRKVYAIKVARREEIYEKHNIKRIIQSLKSLTKLRWLPMLAYS
jgi:mRNA interferase RelE/StbE